MNCMKVVKTRKKKVAVTTIDWINLLPPPIIQSKIFCRQRGSKWCCNGLTTRLLFQTNVWFVPGTHPQCWSRDGRPWSAFTRRHCCIGCTKCSFHTEVCWVCMHAHAHTHGISLSLPPPSLSSFLFPFPPQAMQTAWRQKVHISDTEAVYLLGWNSCDTGAKQKREEWEQHSC